MRTLTLLMFLVALGCGKKKPAPPDPPAETPADPNAERTKWLAAIKAGRPDAVRDAADQLAALAESDPDVLPRLAELLKDKTTLGPGRTRAGQVNSTREAAALALVRVGPKGEAALREKGLPLLKAGLADSSAAIREHTAYTLGTLGPLAKPLSADLQKLCVDPDANVRGAAFDALRWVGVTDSLGLSGLLVHDDATVRRLAGELFLGVTEVPPAAVEPLVKAVGDETEVVRAAAATGLRLSGTKDASAADAVAAALKNRYTSEPDPNERVTDADDACWRALVAVGEAAVPATSDLLKHANPLARALAARALGEIGPPAKTAAPALKVALTDGIAEVALEAACALCRVGDSQADAVALVKRAIEEGERSVPGVAIEAIPRMGESGKPLVPLALSKLTDTNPLTRYAAAAFVATLTAEQAAKAVPDVAKLAADEFPEVRRRAAATLESLGPAASPAAAALGTALRAEMNEIVRDALVDALAAMGTGAKAATPGLLPLIADANAPLALRFKVMSLVALADPSSPDVAAALTKAARGDDKFVRRAAVLALAGLNPLPTDAAAAALVGVAKSDPDYLTRGVAVKALALAGPRAKAVRADVASIAAADNPARALWAKVALASIDGDVRRSAADVRGGLASRDLSVRVVAAEALPLVGPTAADVPALLQLIRERSEAAREAAAVALGRAGPAAKDAVPRLLELLEDGSGDLRAAAAEALGRIGPAAAVAVPRLRAKRTDPVAGSAARRALEKLGAKDEPKR